MSEEGTGIMLASADADSKVRTAAVKDLVASLVGKELSDIGNLVRAPNVDIDCNLHYA